MNSFTITNTNHKNLDGLRAIGILIVLAKHFLGDFINLQFCWIAIDLLFALSGLLITGILIETKEDSRYFKKFYMRRILRIFPIYYLLILGFTFFIFFITKHPGDFSYYKQHLVFFYTYTQNWCYIFYGIPSEGHLNHTWSLAIDEQIYIFWPLLIWLCRSQKQLIILCAGLLLFSCCFRVGYNLYLTNRTSIHPFPYFHHTLCRMDSFGAGALLYCLLKFKAHWLTKNKMLILSLITFILFLVFIFLDRSADFTGYFMRNFGITLIGVHFTSWLYFGIIKSSNWLNSMWGNKRLIYIGKISYSLYVYHWFLLILLLPKINQWLTELGFHSLFTAFMICLLVTFAISILSYEFLEKPIVKIKRKFSYSRQNVMKTPAN
jgi:peptidoglycan/LPS O-acetylase OafA/YrhL